MNRLYVVMGVSGCGKSTLAQQIAQHLNVRFLDADDYHSAQAVAQMQTGIGLTDAQRAPWFDRIGQAIQGQRETTGVLACSALKAAYRQRIRKMARQVIFLWLKVDQDTLLKRLAGRQQHFAGTTLLQSQLATLEPPENEPDVLHFDGSLNSGILFNQVLSQLENIHDH